MMKMILKLTIFYDMFQCNVCMIPKDVIFFTEENKRYFGHIDVGDKGRVSWDALRPPSSGVRLRPRDPWFESPTWNKQIEDIELAITTP